MTCLAALAMVSALFNSDLDSLVNSVMVVFIISEISKPRSIGMISTLVFMGVAL